MEPIKLMVVEDNSELRKMIADYFGKKTEYCCTFTLVGGDIWQNVKIEQNRFKTFEGMILKTY